MQGECATRLATDRPTEGLRTLSEAAPLIGISVRSLQEKLATGNHAHYDVRGPHAHRPAYRLDDAQIQAIRDSMLVPARPARPIRRPGGTTIHRTSSRRSA